VKGNRFGTHRVIEPKGALPQNAQIIDNSIAICDNEILINVNILNITAAAFENLKKKCGLDKGKIATEVMEIVRTRGKFQCPITGSGGMLIGIVEKIGPALIGKVKLTEGQKIATMVSLSLTPLSIDEVLEIDLDTDQVFVKGKAVLFESGIWAEIPSNLSEALSLAVCDVAGAPAWTAKYVVAGDYVAVCGAGKAGLLCLHEAKKRAGTTGLVIAIDSSAEKCALIEKLQLADVVLNLDATNSVPILEAVEKATGGHMCDFVVNTASVPNTEMSSILACRDHGKVLFFSMATVFSKVALGCEGVGKVLTLLVGTGYTEGHAEITYQILRENPELRAYFEHIYGA